LTTAIPAIPERVGRYRVREVLGVGGFATVYRATDERLGIDVAVKVLAENHSLDADVRARFVEEGRRLRRAAGPHLLGVHDIGETDRAQPYLVLDLADRGDLAARVVAVRRQGRGPGPDDLLAVAGVLAAALGDLHRREIVHRDLAPKNLLLRSASPSARPAPPALAAAGPAPDGGGLIGDGERLVLADLGVSKDLAVASGLTVATGTSGFAPPEQRESGRTIDHRADIWAASALVVWLAIDRAPDDAGRWRHEMGTAGWSPGLVQAMERGLALRPDDRYPTIDEWRYVLEESLRPPPAEPTRLGDPMAAQRDRWHGPDRAGRWRWSRRLAVVGAVGLAALVGGVVDATAERAFDGRTVTTTSTAEGAVKTVVEENGVRITMEGPTAVAVDEPVHLTARVEGAEDWLWIGPDGAVTTGADELELTAARPGHGTVHVLATDAHGRTVEASRRLTVTGTPQEEDR
jgi:hypothetical protein